VVRQSRRQCALREHRQEPLTASTSRFPRSENQSFFLNTSKALFGNAIPALVLCAGYASSHSLHPIARFCACPSLLKYHSYFLLDRPQQAGKKASMPKNPALFFTWQRDRFAFGGSRLKASHAKGKRPFSRKLALHLVLRSSRATGERSFLHRSRALSALLFEEAARTGLKMHGAANAGNHLHLLVQAPSREHLASFLRAISGRIAMLVTRACKGRPLAAGTRFWDQRPFSRLVSLGRDFRNVLTYICLNSTETATGLDRRSARDMFNEIRERLRRGEIPTSPGLRAAGFT
jgi:hypothetical protein